MGVGWRGGGAKTVLLSEKDRAAPLHWVEDVGVWFRGCPRQGWNLGWAGGETEVEVDRWRWEIGVEIETALTRHLQKPNNVSQQSLSDVVLW